jgi:CheY-like chemotaxis protein
MKSAPNPPRPTILVVDDEANIRKLVSVNLTSRGYRVREAVSASQALAILAEESPVLMVLDIKLPDFTGWELINRMMKSVHINHSFPILVMTASIMDAQIDLANFPGVSKILIKPFSMRDFISAVEFSLHSFR